MKISDLISLCQKEMDVWGDEEVIFSVRESELEFELSQLLIGKGYDHFRFCLCLKNGNFNDILMLHRIKKDANK